VAFLCAFASGECRARPEAAPDRSRPVHDWVAELATVRAAPIAPHWSDYVPARIALDETQTTRVGALHPGRVTDVWVQRGERVERGAPLFATGDATVRAPRAGVVVERDLELGRAVTTADVIAIADLDSVWAVADIADAIDVAPGALAEVEIGATHLAGVVAQVSTTVDPDRHTRLVRVALANGGGALRPNADARVRWYVAASQAIAVPRTAVVDDGETTFVYVRRGGKLRRQPVIGSPDAGSIAITRGLQAGDEVVARGSDLLDQIP
jgi:hypothetical protein